MQQNTTYSVMAYLRPSYHLMQSLHAKGIAITGLGIKMDFTPGTLDQVLSLYILKSKVVLVANPGVQDLSHFVLEH